MSDELSDEDVRKVIAEADKVSQTSNDSETSPKSKKEKQVYDDGIKWEIFNNETDDDRNW